MIPWRFLSVHPMLMPVVENILYIDIDFSSSLIYPEIKYPWASATRLYFTICNEPIKIKEEFGLYRTVPQNFIIGPKLCSDIVNLGKYRKAVGITFKPGALQRLCGLSMIEIQNQEVDASAIFGNQIDLTQQQLQAAVNVAAIEKIINDFLINLLSKAKHSITGFDKSIAYLVAHHGNVRVEKLAALTGMSIRQFERKSLDKLGVSPKLFSRLARFSQAYLKKETFPHQKWASICYEFGYADQMHLINEFKKFSGFTPSGIDELLALPSINLATALATTNTYSYE